MYTMAFTSFNTILFFFLLTSHVYSHTEPSLLTRDVAVLLNSIPHHPPDAVTRGIINQKEQFLRDLFAVINETPPDIVRLVDKQHSVGTFVPKDLVPLDRYDDTLTLSKANMVLSATLIPDLLAMVSDAKKEGVIIPISSAYRSYEYQKGLFERNVRTLGKHIAERESAQAGTSQHQLGLAIDFGNIDDSFADTKASRWLRTHAWKYGFSLSYPKGQEAITGYRYESWHYRYIGRPAAAFEKKYFKDGQQYVLELLAERQAIEYLYNAHNASFTQ